MYKPSNVMSIYGAPMGRRSDRIHEGAEVTIESVRIDSGGYDSGGAYWGIGAPLYVASWVTEDDNGESFFRASDMDAARAHVLDMQPEVTFRDPTGPETEQWDVMYHFDVWGHAPCDCCKGYDCPCVDEDGGHDDNACQCGYEVNDSCYEAPIDLPANPTAEDIRSALGITSDVEVLNSGCDTIDVFEIEDGRPVYTLSRVY